jgi:hypothetical protein
MLASPTARSYGRPVAKLAVSLACAAVVFSVVNAGPAAAGYAVKTITNCSPGQVDTTIPTPTAATDVSAARYGAVKGKAKVSWAQTNQRYPNPYTLFFRVLTSNGRCTAAKEYKTGGTCLNFKKGSTAVCKMKRLPSGATEFRVALWYQDPSGAAGAVTYSAWSNTVNVK